MCNLSEGIVDRVTEQVTRDVTRSVTKSVTRSVTRSVTKSVTKAVTKEVTLKNRVESVRNLMLSTGWQMEQAMAALRIPESMWPGIRNALAN